MRYQEERQLEEQRAQVGARMKQYEDELARKRLMSEHELQRQVRGGGAHLPSAQATVAQRLLRPMYHVLRLPPGPPTPCCTHVRASCSATRSS